MMSRGQIENFFKTISLKTWSSGALVLALILATTGVLSLHRLQTEYSVMQFLPEHHPAIQMDREVRAHFHLTDLPLFIGVVTLAENETGTWLEADRIKKLTQATQELKTISGVGSAISLGNIDGAVEQVGLISVAPLVQVTAVQDWPDRILKDPLLTPNLITADQKTVLIYLQLTNANVELMAHFAPDVKQILQKYYPSSIINVGGVPAIQTDLGLLINQELKNFLLLTALACALTLFLIFESLSTLLIPLILTIFANIMVFAMMAWTGLPFTILSATIPILVFITVVSLSVHFLLRMDEEATHTSESEPRVQLIWRVHKAIWLPNLLGALTTCVGFLTLLAGDVPLIRDYGIAVAGSVLLSWLLTSTWLLPLTFLFPQPRPRKWVHRPARWALWTIHNAKPIVLLITLTCLTLVITSRNLYWTAKLFDDLPAGQASRQITEKIDRHMGGMIPLEIVITAAGDAPWNDPERIVRLDQLLTELRKTEGLGSAYSLPDFFHALEHLEHPIIPDSRKSIAEIYFLYSMAEKNPIENYLADHDHSARIEVRLHDLPANEMKNLVTALESKVQAVFPLDKVSVGGMGAIVHVINDELSTELIFGFWQALGFICLFLAFIFRSLRWALVACLPHLVPPVALLGYLSITQTPIKPGVAIIFSIALGLAFNNTVYVLNRLRELTKKGQRLPIAKTFYLEGNPCLVSTCIMLVGFSVFLFSYFSLNQTFGACMIISIAGGIVGDLILLPALLHLWPWMLGPMKLFLFRKQEASNLHK